MLMIVGLVSCISAVIPAPINETKNTSYILATVLFYKDVNGKVILASGPIPEAAAMAISDDVSSRFKDASVKVVPAFDKPETSLNTSHVVDTIKNKYKNVFAITVQKRLSRNAIVDWWNNLFHKTNKPKVKKRSTQIKDYMETTQAGVGLNSSCKTVTSTSKTVTSSSKTVTSSSKTTLLTTTEAPQLPPPVSEKTTKPPKQKMRKISKVDFAEEEDRFNEFFQGNEHSGEKSDPKRLRYFDQFLPNDIYYSIEKKCVNWSDGCSHHSGLTPNMSNLYLAYIKPHFPALPLD